MDGAMRGAPNALGKVHQRHHTYVQVVEKTILKKKQGCYYYALSNIVKVGIFLPQANYKKIWYVFRFRIEVKVRHEKESSKFVLWDNECRQLLKQTAHDLKKQLIAVCTCYDI